MSTTLQIKEEIKELKEEIKELKKSLIKYSFILTTITIILIYINYNNNNINKLLNSITDYNNNEYIIKYRIKLYDMIKNEEITYAIIRDDLQQILYNIKSNKKSSINNIRLLKLTYDNIPFIFNDNKIQLSILWHYVLSRFMIEHGADNNSHSNEWYRIYKKINNLLESKYIKDNNINEFLDKLYNKYYNYDIYLDLIE